MTENRIRTHGDGFSDDIKKKRVRRRQGNDMSERGNSPRRSGRRSQQSKEILIAMAVIVAMLACMTAVIISILFAGGREAEPAQPTAGTPVWNYSQQDAQWVMKDDIGKEKEFQQLSDPFLVLVNDEVPLPDNWEVTPSFIGDETVDTRIYNKLSAMFQAAADDGVDLWVCSGYRSVEDQEKVLNREVELHMNEGMSEDEARQLSLRTIARPGHSEHHTGFVVDLNDVSDNFEETDAYQWLNRHAAEYGFVQRYRTDKVDITGIDNESWHYRYVGVGNAQEMERLDMCLEEYVQYLKDQGIK